MVQPDTTDVVLVAPWLSRAVPAWFAQPGLMPEVPALRRWLARADRLDSSVAGIAIDAAAAHFGVTPGEGGDCAWAALAQAGERVEPEPGCWLRIDPVHLRPDMAQLLLFMAPDLELTRTEAQALGETVAECLAEWGDLRVLHPARWYLRLRDTTPLATIPPDSLAGQAVQGALPGGAAGRRWRTLINEVQMLLFEHPVNQQREARGLPAINSVWPWGWGFTPAVPATRYRSVTTESPLVRGLARLGGVEDIRESGSLRDWLEQGLRPGEHLIWLEVENARSARDPDGWSDWLRRMEDGWFSPLLDLLREKQLRSALLHGGDGQAWRVTATTLRRFWRRASPLAARLRMSAQESG